MSKQQRPVLLIVILVLIVGLVGPVALPGMAKAVHAHPLLQQLAKANPDSLITVIVQKARASDRAEQLTRTLGGVITKDLHIINAFAAEMRAGAALELAASQAVRWVSLDAPVAPSGEPIDITKLTSAYVKAVGADQVWNEGPAYLQGQGVSVAVVDSGNCQNSSTNEKTCNDLLGPNNLTRVVAAVSKKSGHNGTSPLDLYGHGSLVEGVVGGTGIGSGGKYMGIAPNVNLVSVKIADNLGQALSSDVVSGLQWVLDNKSTYNIRVVNLSLNSSTPESYHTNPIAAACEILWFNGIVVVVSAGNNGTASLYPPANDPFVITVGATNDKGTSGLADDVLASFSAYGMDETGAIKPDLVAPGTNLISIVPRTKNKIWKDHQSNYIGESAQYEYYMRVSGTSFAAPVVSGTVALLLQDEPNLNPDQVKYRLMATGNKNWPGYNPATAGAGYLDAYAAVHGTTTESANTGITASQLLWTGENPVTWGSVAWDSVAWNSVAWNSVAWNSVAWNSVAWNSDYWEP